MTLEVNFVLACEGVSDAPLVSVIRELLLDAGATSAYGESLPMSATVEDKVHRVLREFTGINLLFVHRDSDSRNHDHRYNEIRDGADKAGWELPLVAVVPVHMTEAWLLTSELEIREIAGKPSGRTPLNLPGINGVERCADPKTVLRDAYMAASESTGRKRKTAERAFGARRAALLERLDIQGDVGRLASFARLRDDIRLAVDKVKQLNDDAE